MKTSSSKTLLVPMCMTCIMALYANGVNFGTETPLVTHPKVGLKLQSSLRPLEDCPTCPFQDLNENVWVDSLRGVKKLTARGADGFSTRDCTLIQGELLSSLLQILQHVESGDRWPQQWVLARVVVLSKGYEPKTPLDIRPISILSKFYRLWSRLRSLEVLKHIGKLMPPQVSATAGGVSADLLAAHTADQIESSQFHGNPMCGIIIDLVKCYNLLPWLPSQWILG